MKRNKPCKGIDNQMFYASYEYEFLPEGPYILTTFLMGDPNQEDMKCYTQYDFEYAE